MKKKSGKFGVSDPTLPDISKELFKTYKPGTSGEKRGEPNS
jgi:hypothetical protein